MGLLFVWRTEKNGAPNNKTIIDSSVQKVQSDL